MNIDNLIHMANQIGAFFESMPDGEEARLGIVTHIQKFWDPRMRRAFLAAVDAGGAAELKAIVQTAVQEHRALLA